MRGVQTQFEDKAVVSSLLDSLVRDIETWWGNQGQEPSLLELDSECVKQGRFLADLLVERFATAIQPQLLKKAGAAFSWCMLVKGISERLTVNELWFSLNIASWDASALFALTDTIPQNYGREMAKLRHKDNHADRDFIRQWYRENRATYEKELGGKGGKDAAATDAKEQRRVDQGWRTIRGYLNNI